MRSILKQHSREVRVVDTYDKIVFDDVRNNAILAAILVYQACEDPNKTSREKNVLPLDTRTNEPGKWPEQRGPIRKGGLD
jgi:carboxypeptidase Q